MKATYILFAIGTGLVLGACASATSNPRDMEEGPRAQIVRDDTQIVIDTGGVPPDKEAEIKGTVKVIITIDTSGHGQPRTAGGTLGNQEVESCLVGVLREFEYPKLDRGGDVQYEYKFEPQY